MSFSSRRSRSARLGLWLLSALLFAGGVFLGMKLAAPPKRPDFGTPSAPAAPRPEPARADDETRAADQGGAAEEARRPADAGPAEAEPGTAAALDLQPAAHQLREAAAGGRRLAIVIDDLGRSVAVIDALEKLEGSFTYAVLPFEVQTAAVVAELDRRGLEFLCHLPMEAQGGIDAGTGALRARMGLDELKAATRRALSAVPGAIGVNNHMGSALVGDAAAMRAILNVVGEKSLFFLDSRTATNTKGFEVARELGLRAAERHVFLDNEIDGSAIRRQFELFKETATQRGFAIAIGHPHETTIAVLSEEIPKAQAEGFEMVHVSSLLSP